MKVWRNELIAAMAIVTWMLAGCGEEGADAPGGFGEVDDGQGAGPGADGGGDPAGIGGGDGEVAGEGGDGPGGPAGPGDDGAPGDEVGEGAGDGDGAEAADDGAGVGEGEADGEADGEGPGQGDGGAGEGEGDRPIPVLRPGDLVITEFMPNPVDRDQGAEYFEVLNNTVEEIDLHGLEFRDLPSNNGDFNSYLVDEQLVVAAGAYVLFGALDNGERTGPPVDFTYPWGGFTLANGEDEIILKAGDVVVDEIRYDPSWGVAQGAAIRLDPDSTDSVANDDPLNWCPGPPSPGQANASCDGGDDEGDEDPPEGEGDAPGEEGEGEVGQEAPGEEGEGEVGQEGPGEEGEIGQEDPGEEGEEGEGEGIVLEPEPGGAQGEACEHLCDCQQGLGCIGGICEIDFNTRYCCSRAACPPGEGCLTRGGENQFCPGDNGEEGEGEAPGDECEGPCDCPQGENCENGFCIDDPNFNQWCCDNQPLCPQGDQCVTRDGQVEDCVGDPPDDCATACDCPVGQHCQQNQCREFPQALYCCDDAQACPAGSPCEGSDGAQGFCGGDDRGGVGDPCDGSCDCEPGLSCGNNGRCAESFPIVWCCDDDFCPENADCDDAQGRRDACGGGGAEGDGEVECQNHCDCAQGQICAQGACLQGAEPKYCCGVAGCVGANACEFANGDDGCCDGAAANTCREVECQSPCDCPQGRDCVNGSCEFGGNGPVYCCGENGCPGASACEFANGNAGCCDGRPANQCEGDDSCGSDCQCGGATPYCVIDDGAFLGECAANPPAINDREFCCDAAECSNAGNGDAPFNRRCWSGPVQDRQCGCCGVANRDCCGFGG